jgi:hypothetical protein
MRFTLGPHRYRELVGDHARTLELERNGGDIFLSEFRAAAALVQMGAARRVVLCDYPDVLPFPELRRLATPMGVEVEPIVRIAGQGFDLGVTRRVEADG